MIIERSRYDEPYKPKNKNTIKHFIWLSSFIEEDNKPAEAHFQLVDHILSKSKYKVIMCHRGLGKSTKMSHLILEWLFLGRKPNFGDFKNILIIQDTVTMVEATFEQLIALIENTELNKYLKIEKKRLGDDPTIYVRNIEKNKVFYLKGRGSGQSLRGAIVLGKRPNIVIFDDIENEEKHLNKNSRDKLKKWFNNVVVPTINPNKFEFIFIGTPIHEDSLLMNLVNSNSWKTLVLPVAEDFPPENWNELITSWKDRFTPEFVKEIYDMLKEQGKEKSFYQEYMLEVTPQDDLLYDTKKINKFKLKEFSSNLNRLTYYISIDLAVSEKEYADYTSIAVIGVDQNNNWFLVDGFYGRIKPDITIDKIFYFVNKWKPYEVVLEKVAFQLSMKTFIQNEMIKRGRFFNLKMISRTKGKLSVLKGFQPIVELGRFWIPEDVIIDFTEELLHEMELITNDSILSKHDDLIDSISQLTLIDTISIEPLDYDNENSYDVQYENPYVF